MKYSGFYTIRTSEITSDKTLSIPSMIMLMQEASMQNVIALKASVWDMEKESISWVILRKKLNIYTYPVLGQQVKIITYPSFFEKIFAYRDYKIYDASDRLMAQASSTWTLLNTQSRKLQRIPPVFLDMPIPKDEEVLNPPESRIRIPEAPSFSKSAKVGWFDTDWNQHTNNVYLIKSILEATPDKTLKNQLVKELVYHVRSESFWGDTLLVSGNEIEKNVLAYQMTKQETGKVVAQANIVWE